MIRSVSSSLVSAVAVTLQVAVLALGLSLPLAARADTDAGGAAVSGWLEAGGRVVTGDDWQGKGKFHEYTSEGSGGVVSGDVLVEDQDHAKYVRSVVDFVDDNDQHYELDIGRWGHYGLEMSFDNFPHNYSRNAVTPLSRGQNGKLFLPPTWTFTGAIDPVELNANLQSRSLGFRLLEGKVRGFYRPVEGLELTTEYSIQDKQGTQPGSLTFGFGGGFVNIAKPIDDRTHNFGAGATYAGKDWSLGLAYNGSYYVDELHSITMQNFRYQTDAAGQPAYGRNSTAPDNSSHVFSLSGSAVVPTSFPSRVAGTFSYGIRLQDDNFIPYTINTALAPGALPQSNLNGEVQTILGNLVYTARPMDKVNVEARYRIYDLDNRSDHITFDARVPYDDNVTVGAFENELYDYRRQNGDLKVAYQVTAPGTLHLGFSWENWRRSQNREVHHSNELTGTIGGDYKINEWATFKSRLSLGDKEGTYFTVGTAQLPQLRKYDEADRLRVASDLRLMLVPTELVLVTLSGGTTHDDYSNSDFGLVWSHAWHAGFDVEYSPFEWMSLAAYYEYDYTKRQQRSINRSAANELPSAAPDNIWVSNDTSMGHNVGVDMKLVLVKDLLDARIGYEFQKGDADTDARPNNPNNPGAAANPVDYPDIDDTLNIVTTELTWHAMENLDLIGAYRFEDWRHQNFQTDPLGVYFTGNDVYLGNKVSDYTAHVFTVSARYEF